MSKRLRLRIAMASILIVLATVACVGFWRVEAGDPEIEIPTAVDLGELHAHQRVNAEIPFRNVGGGRLIIEEVQAGCTCVKPQGDFGRGQSGSVTVEFDAAALPGMIVERMVAIRANDPQRPIRQVTVRGRMANYLEAIPSRQSVRILLGNSFRDEFRIRSTSPGEKFRLLEMASSIEGLKVSAPESGVAKEEIGVEIAYSQASVVGSQEGEIRIKTHSIHTPMIRIPVSIETEPRIKPVPELVLLRPDGDGGFAAIVRLDAAFPVRIRPRNIDVKIRPLASDSESETEWSERWEFSCRAGEDVEPGTAGKLRFDVEGDSPTPEVEVRYAVLR